MIEVFFDVSSPFAYMGFERIQPLAAELGMPVTWKPVMVGGIFNAVNTSVYESREHGVPAKQAYLKKDLLDWARHVGVTIRFPPAVFPLNSVKVMRGCCWLLARGGPMVDFARAAFQAYWGDEQDLSRDAALAALCARTGVDAAALLEAIASPEIKLALKANTDEAIARGAFGVPTFFIGGDDMYFGNDRMPLIRDALRRRLIQTS